MRRWLLSSGLVVLALLVTAAPATAQAFRQATITTSSSDVTLTTTTEKVIITSDPLPVTTPTARICVIGWAQLTTGTNTTTVTPNLREGSTITGTLLTEANAETILAAAGSTEPYFAIGCETRTNVESVTYSFTLTQAGASANGTALQAGILVLEQ